MWGNNWDLWQQQKAGNGSRKPDTSWQNTALNQHTQLNKEEREQIKWLLMKLSLNTIANRESFKRACHNINRVMTSFLLAIQSEETGHAAIIGTRRTMKKKLGSKLTHWMIWCLFMLEMVYAQFPFLNCHKSNATIVYWCISALTQLVSSIGSIPFCHCRVLLKQREHHNLSSAPPVL